MDRDFLTYGIISAIVAHQVEAVSDMLSALARIDPHHADQILQSISRGIKANADRNEPANQQNGGQS